MSPFEEGTTEKSPETSPFEAETAKKVASGVSPFVAEDSMKLHGVDIQKSERTVPKNTSSSKVQS